ncbi:unnamed protein product, partial [Amoebophrya sp. A25]
ARGSRYTEREIEGMSSIHAASLQRPGGGPVAKALHQCKTGYIDKLFLVATGKVRTTGELLAMATSN